MRTEQKLTAYKLRDKIAWRVNIFTSQWFRAMGSASKAAFKICGDYLEIMPVSGEIPQGWEAAETPFGFGRFPTFIFQGMPEMIDGASIPLVGARKDSDSKRLIFTFSLPSMLIKERLNLPTSQEEQVSLSEIAAALAEQQ